MPDATARILGVGIDIEEREALARFGPDGARRAAERWLDGAERSWCDSQDAPDEAVVLVLCCREAVFKAWSGGRAVHDVRVRLEGTPARGRGSADQAGVPVRVEWRMLSGRFVAVAVAAEGCPA